MTDTSGNAVQGSRVQDLKGKMVGMNTAGHAQFSIIMSLV
jgi:hypothetical protein